jgi:hypothetical protein
MINFMDNTYKDFQNQTYYTEGIALQNVMSVCALIQVCMNNAFCYLTTRLNCRGNTLDEVRWKDYGR